MFRETFFESSEEIVQKVGENFSFILLPNIWVVFFLKFLFMLFCLVFVLPKRNKMALVILVQFFSREIEITSSPHSKKTLNF